jgi:hypothetical protein
MNNLKEFVIQINKIEEQLEQLCLSGINGISTLTSRIKEMQNHIASNNYENTAFDTKSFYNSPNKTLIEQDFQIFLNNLPEFQNKLNVDYIGKLQTLVEQDNFSEDWTKLKEEEKTSIIFLSKEAYPILRTKLNLDDFNFLLKDVVKKKDYPQVIDEWIHSQSKVTFFKLRKQAQNSEHEMFFNSDEVKTAETLNVEQREIIAGLYLSSNNQSNINWYNKLDSLTTRDISFFYTYNFLVDLEDKYNGYAQIKKNIQLPDLLKIWIGDIVDPQLSIEYKEAKEKYYAERQTEIEKNGIGSPLIDHIDKKYPIINQVDMSPGIGKPFTKNEFEKLKNQAKDTDLEAFFNHDFSEAMHKEMPYKRSNYMFVYFRDSFMKQNQKKLKI